MSVKVFSTKTCPWCDKVKEYLDSLKVSYESVDIQADHAAAKEMVKKTRQMGVPVTSIGERYIVGYAPEEIRSALEDAGLIQ